MIFSAVVRLVIVKNGNFYKAARFWIYPDCAKERRRDVFGWREVLPATQG